MLTELDSLKKRLGVEVTDTVDDTVLENFILACTGRFDRECNRKFALVDGATYEFDANRAEVLPDRYPIISVSAWHLKANETDGWEAQSGVDYLIRRACVISLTAPLGSELEVGRVTYKGGYVLPGSTTGAGETELPDEIEQACIEQCAYWFQRRNQLGLVSVSGEGGAISNFAKLDLLPSVSALLEKYNRLVI